MTDFIDFEVSVEGNNQNEEEDDEVNDSDLDSLKSFIDNNDEIENDRKIYQNFESVTTSIEDVLKEGYDKSMVDVEKVDIFDFCETSEEEVELDKFKDTEKGIEKFKKTLFPVSTDSKDENNYNTFINAIFFTIRFNLNQKKRIL